MTAPTQSEQDRVVIFDTTLRDGEHRLTGANRYNLTFRQAL